MRVLIVDDDLLQLEKIETGLDWEMLGVNMVFTASNILQAKKILDQEDIKLIIADIEMPGGSGLELLKWVKEREMNCKCIFVSSYASFAYAQEAISLQSSHYLLKPVTNKELSEAVSQSLSTFRKSETVRAGQQRKIKKQFWNEYLECCRRGTISEDIRLWAEDLYTEKERFWVMLIQDLSEKDDTKQELCQLNEFQIQEMAGKAWEENKTVCEAVLFYGEKTWICIGQGGSDQPAVYLAQRLCQEKMKSRVFFAGDRTAALSDVFSVLNLLIDVSSKAIVENVGFLDVLNWNSRRETNLEPFLITLKGKIKTTTQLRALGDQLVFEVKKECSFARMTNSVMVLVCMFVTELRYIWLEQQKLQPSMLFDEEEYRKKYEESVFSLEKFSHFVGWMFEKMENYHNIDAQKESVASKIKRYIDENIEKNLTRKELADVVHLSENYISGIFAEEIGMSIPNYITVRRMELAKEYLRNTNHGISQIAVEVGYTNFSYFSKSFKEHVGCTPNEYRKRN